MNRAELDANTLLGLVLVLVVIWIAVEILDFLTDLVSGLFELFSPLIGLLVVAVIVLWLVDKL